MMDNAITFLETVNGDDLGGKVDAFSGQLESLGYAAAGEHHHAAEGSQAVPRLISGL